jgi:hypothetical protein
MTEQAIQALELKLDSVLAQLKATKDPALRRTLLTEMRGLIAELDRLVLESASSYSAKPDPE